MTTRAGRRLGEVAIFLLILIGVCAYALSPMNTAGVKSVGVTPANATATPPPRSADTFARDAGSASRALFEPTATRAAMTAPPVAAVAFTATTAPTVAGTTPTPAGTPRATSVPPTATPAATASPTRQGPTATPSARQLVERTFVSPAMGRSMHYRVYLPAGYAESTRRYPVLYMLHGRGDPNKNDGNNSEWVVLGLPEAADQMIQAGEIPPMIIVMPQGDAGYWTNHAGNGPRWGDYTATDLVKHIDATYRTVADAAHRAVGGLSMGGHGSLQLAVNYPGVFGVVGMHSPTLRSFADRPDFFGDAAFFAAHDPASLVRKYPERARALKIFIDVGKQDNEWRDSTTKFHDLLTAQGIPHTFQTWTGSHGKDYWRAHCRDYLRFYGASLAPA